jgi:signal transduction histidine kinase
MTNRKRADDSLRELTARLLALQEEERRLMARELEDSITQTLTALSLSLASIGEYTQDIELRDRTGSLRKSGPRGPTRELRTFSYLLHPRPLEEAARPRLPA